MVAQVDELAQIAGEGGRAAVTSWEQWFPTLATDFVTNVVSARRQAAPGQRRQPQVTTLVDWAVRSHADDLDDVHYPSLTHPGSVMWPVALTLGSETGACVRDVAAALALGYEVTARLGACLKSQHGLHSTGTAGSAGAAACASVLLGLPVPGLADAIAHAVSASGGLGQAVVEASGTRAFHRASAASIGVLAARLRADGLTASRAVLEGQAGLWALLPGADPAALLAADRPAAPATCVRVERVSGFYQAAIFALRHASPARRRVVRVPSLVARFSDRQPPGRRLAESVRAVLGPDCGDLTVEGADDLQLHEVELVADDQGTTRVSLPDAADPRSRTLVAGKALSAGLDREAELWAAATTTPTRAIADVVAESAIGTPQIGVP